MIWRKRIEKKWKIQKKVSSLLLLTFLEELRNYARDADNRLSHEKLLKVIN
jgi:hypothetical protein